MYSDEFLIFYFFCKKHTKIIICIITIKFSCGSTVITFMVIPSLHTFIFHCFIFDSQSLEQWGKPPSSGTAFKSVGTASKLTKDIQYCDSLWLYGKSWKTVCWIDKRNLSGNNRFIFLICLKGVLYCRCGEGEHTHKHTQSWFQRSITLFSSTDTTPDTHCRQIIACYIKTGKVMYELFMGWRSLKAAILLQDYYWSWYWSRLCSAVLLNGGQRVGVEKLNSLILKINKNESFSD